MNTTNLINDIITLEGLRTLALPFKEPIEVVLTDYLKTAIRTFSHFKPYKKEGYQFVKRLRSRDEISKRMNEYYLPEQLCTTYIHSASAFLVNNVPRAGDLNISGFTVGSPFVGFGSYMPQDILDSTSIASAINKYVGVTTTPVTFDFLPPNQIRLYDVPMDSIMKFIVNTDHDLSGETIEEGCVEYFKKIATLTIEASLYNALLPYQEVGSAHKSIQMKLERWAGSQEKLDTLIDHTTEVFHLDNISEYVQFF